MISAAGVLFGSWLVAWLLPTVKTCVAISCGANFDRDEVPFLPFLTWAQLLAILGGLVIFFILVRSATTSGRRRNSRAE